MPTTAPKLEPAPLGFDRVGFAIGRRTILSDITLQVRPREVLCVLGPSGCGKTTLLRIAAGIERQTSGTVSVAGAAVADGAVFVPPEQRSIGFVFQDLALFPHMSVRQNVAYGLGGERVAGLQADEALAQVGLAGTGRRYPHQLSGGQQQRVALARALLPAPSVVLFDEPFSSLDRSLRDAVRQDVASVLRARGATALIVTHDADEALSLADRIALMRDGTVVQLTSPAEIWRAPVDLAAARVFSSVAAFHARAEGGVAETPVGRVPVPFDGAVTVAFRPEALRVAGSSVAAAGEGAGAGEGVEARVAGRRFFGGSVELAATIAGHELFLRADPSLVPETGVVRVVPDLARAIILKGMQ